MAPLPWPLAVCSPVLLVLLLSTERVLSDGPSFETPNHRHKPVAGKQRHRRRQIDGVVYQYYYGGTAEVDLKRLAEDQAAAGWTEAKANLETKGVTYSVIVVEWRHHHSYLFHDQERVRAHTAGSEGGTVTSVQFANPFPQAPCSASRPPFSVRHPAGTDKRVLVVYASDLVEPGAPLDALQVSHLRASCENPAQTTVLVMADETCQRPGVPDRMPHACLANLEIRFYPFNTASPGFEPRYAYMPLGPRSTFSFLDPSVQRDASARPLLFNLEVTARTSIRREELIETTVLYTRGNPDVPCAAQSGEMDAEQWQDLLLDSKFTVSPGGHNAETYRMWEALEAGSIPIVSKLDYTHPGYNGTTNCGVGEVAWNTVAASPFAKDVSVADWTELPALLDRLRQEPDHYIDSLQAACRLWYAAVMNRTYASLLDFGEGNELFPQEGPLLDDVRGPP